MIRNPFKDSDMRRCFDGAVKTYQERHRNFFYEDGKRHSGNSWATDFWRGYDGVSLNWDAASKKTSGYVYYKAGQAIRKSEGDTPLFPRLKP